MNKQQKVEVLENLTNQLKNTKSATIVDYKGMTMTDLQALRSALSPVGGSFTVVKNTLLRLALKNSFAGGASSTSDTFGTFDSSAFEGQTALILSSDDEIAPLQALAKHLKTSEKPALKFGIFDGKIVDTNDLTILSKLPGKQTLYGQLVGSLAGLSYGLVGVLNANLQMLVSVLGQREKQLSN